MPAVDSRTQSLQSQLQAKKAEIDEGLKLAVKVDGENVEVSQADADKLRSLMAECKSIESVIRAETYSGEIKSFLDQPVEESIAMQASARKVQTKSLGRMLIESDEFKSMQAAKGATMANPFELEAFNLPAMGRKDVYNDMVSDGTPVNPQGFGSVQFDPIVPRGHRVVRVRDLFPNVATNANLIDFFRVTGFVAGGEGGNAASVADYASSDFGLKPQSSMEFSSAQAPVRTIAHWEAAHRNALSDTPQLQGIIDNELLYGLALEEDRQILDGSGTDDELEGILQTSGTQAYSQGGDELKVESLRRAATKAIIANYPATGYVLHPYDWEDIELTRASDGGDGQFIVVTNVAIGAGTQVWRQPVVETPAIAQGTFLTGAFGLGAQVYDRQQANVRIAEQHSDFFVRNAVAVLAEQRIALAVKRPESFVVGTFSDAPAS